MIRTFAASLFFATATAAAAPAHPLQMPSSPPASSDAMTVQYGGGHRSTYSERHYRWCENRYRSYQRASNSYWNNYGQQRQCRSPYM